jgi:hypothetical protein
MRDIIKVKFPATASNKSIAIRVREERQLLSLTRCCVGSILCGRAEREAKIIKACF